MTGNRSRLVSIVMPVYNTEKYLAEAIESILSQTFADFEFIIVDDGSEDNSAGIIRSYETRDERIRFIQLAENVGEARARNAGLAVARGEFYACQDSDDISLPERLQKQVSFLQSRPEVGAVGVHAHVVSEDLQRQRVLEPPERHAEIMLDHFIGLLSAPYLCGALMMRLCLVLEVGGYDEAMHYSGDCELMTRLLGRTMFANIADFLYLYRRRSGQRTTHDNPKRDRDMLSTRQRRLERIWGEAPLETLERLARIKPWSKLSWRERRAAKRDIIRLIDSIIAAEWIEAGERPHLIEAMNRRLERVSPRIWQMFCHWRRHHFGGKNSSVKPV